LPLLVLGNKKAENNISVILGFLSALLLEKGINIALANTYLPRLFKFI